jgi:DNA-binding response OmpR family regulator
MQANKFNVLMIDADVRLCSRLRGYLLQRGIDVTIAHRSAEGLAKVKTGGFDAVILEMCLPGTSGFQVLREIRAYSSIPVLILTVLNDEARRIRGLELGADDYISKTITARELQARIRAVLRYKRPAPPAATSAAAVAAQAQPEEIVVSDIRVNTAKRRATRDQKALELTSLEFDLLLCLTRAAGNVLERDQLLDQIAGRSCGILDRSIDVHISSLRRKIGDDPKNPRYIKTIRSIGYKFVADPRQGAAENRLPARSAHIT